jgi:hypothetical protein
VSDYLFDKVGDPDPDVAELEALLAPLAYRRPAPALPGRRRPRPFVVAAVAATAMAAALVALLLAHPWRPRPTGWVVGAWVDTSETGTRLVVPALGTVELGPHTRARIAAEHAMQLERGTLAAVIHAPPRQFVVTTPHAVVTDLGCAFEVSVDEAGRGRVVVREGRVGVAGGDGHELVVAAGEHVELSEHGPVAASPPALPPPAAPAPTPPAAPTSPAPTPPAHAAPAPRHHAAVHATKKPAVAHPTRTTAAPPQQPHATPAKKSEPTRIQHDALKDLQHDVE